MYSKCLALLLLLVATVPAAADCTSDEQKLNGMVANLNAQSGSMGICQMARQSVALYKFAAAFHRRCVPGPSGQAQAAEYDRAAREAQATANASCQ